MFEATGTLPESAVAQECSLDEILRIAFKDSYFINDRTHPVLRRLRGEL